VATIGKMRRLVNPGKRKRKMSALQKMFFGSKRQRAAVSNPRARKASQGSRRFRKATGAKRKYYAASHSARLAKRYKFNSSKRRKRQNVGSIITVWPKKRNPSGRRRRKNRSKKVIIVNKGAKMAYRRRRRAKAVSPRRRRRRTPNVHYVRRIKRGSYRYSNPGRRRRRYARRGVVHHRRRRGNPGRRRHYRHNPGMLTGTMGRVLGVVGGVAVTKLLCGFLPASLNTGILGYLSTGVVAVAQGKLVGKFSKSAQLGNDMLVGGLAYLAAKVLNDFFPSIGAYTGISGMGMIGGSSFYVPQVNRGGSMGSFLLPSAVSGAIGAAIPAQTARGMGVMRRTGRLM